MNIVFMGTPDFAVPSLEILLKHKYTISAVVTAPDKPRGRGQQVSFTPVKESALTHSLNVLQPVSLNDREFVSAIASLTPDLIVVVAFRILPESVFTIPAKGSFNLHASLLPKYRGAAPINWAIINGEKESGVTTFFLQNKVDTGNVILQARVALTDEMTAGDLHDVLADVGAEIVLQTVRLIELGRVEPRKQDDTIATPAPKLFKETCRINWKKPAPVIHNFIRGLSPYPTAWTTHNGKVIKIYKSSLDTEYRIQNTEDGSRESEPGTIVQIEKKLFIQTADELIGILELQQEGKKRMSAEEFLRGYRFNEGDLFV